MFTHVHWPDMAVYAKQREILTSVRDNWTTFVHAANKMGKTRCAALVAIWFFATRFPARVITTSSSEAQLAHILWSEIGALIRTSAIPFAYKKNFLELRTVNTDTGNVYDEHYMVGHVAKSIENFQGHHLDFTDIPRVLFIIDEGSGVDDMFFEAAESQAHRILVIGNPLNTTNFFFKGCKKGDAESSSGIAKLDRHVIHISGEDSPNVIAAKRYYELGGKGRPPSVIPGVLQWHEYLYRKKHWDKSKKRTRLEGLFDEDSDALMFPMTKLDAAQEVWPYVPNHRGPFSMGLDVAMGGRDKTVWVIIDRFGVFDVIVRDYSDTMQIAGETIVLMNKYDIPGRRVCVDAGGGKSICDRLEEQARYVNPIWFGSSAEDSKSYFNARAEMYDMLSSAMDVDIWQCTKTGSGWEFPTIESEDEEDKEPEIAEHASCFALPPEDDLLREELACLPLIYDSEGKLRMLPKDVKNKLSETRKVHEKTIKELIGRSPDRADALALAVYARGNHVFVDQPDASALDDDDAQDWADFASMA